MVTVSSQLAAVRERIRAACDKAGRLEDSVKLVAVSKTFPATDIAEAADSGQVAFGESRLQEADPKIGSLPADLEWHFIGGIQRNKVRKILPLFPIVHAVDSMKLATYIDKIAGELKLAPKVFLQVNQAGEESKGGFGSDELRRCVSEIAKLKNIKTLGLMVIPPADGEPRRWFGALREFRDELERDFPIQLPNLSMGMSGDFEVAIEEGATHVRVGSSIFGNREGSNHSQKSP